MRFYPLKSLYLQIIYIFLVSIRVYALSPDCISPNTIFNNSIYLLEDESINRKYNNFYSDRPDFELNEKSHELISLIKDYKGEIDFYSFNYYSSNELQNHQEINTNKEKLKDLFKKRIKTSGNLPCFFIVKDKKNKNIPDLFKWLQENFKDRSFLVIPCTDDFEKNPIIEKEPYKFQQWYEFKNIIEMLGFKQNNYISSQASNKIAGKIDENYSFKGEKLNDDELAIIYGDIDREKSDKIIANLKESSSSDRYKILSILAKRDLITENLLRSIIPFANTGYFVSLYKSKHYDNKHLTKLLFEEAKHIHRKTFEDLIKNLIKDEDEIAGEMFYNYCINIDFLNKDAENDYGKVNPINVFLDYSIPVNKSKFKEAPYIKIFKILYDKGFSDWDKIFNNQYEIDKQREMLDNFIKQYPQAGNEILKTVFSKNPVISLNLLSSFVNNQTNTNNLDYLLKKITAKDPILHKLNLLMRREDIPLMSKGEIVIHALTDNPFYTTEEYISLINQIFSNPYILEILAEKSTNIAPRDNLLSLINSYPYTFNSISLFKNDYPERYTNPLLFILANDNNSYTQNFHKLLTEIVISGWQRKYFTEKRQLHDLIDVLCSQYIFTSTDKETILYNLYDRDKKVTIFPALEKFLEFRQTGNEFKNNEYFVKHDLHLSLIYPLAKTDDHELLSLIADIFQWKELKRHKISRLKLLTFFNNKNIHNFKEPLKLLLKSYADKRNNTLKNKKRLIKTLSWFSMFLNLPDKKNLNISDILVKKIYEAEESFYNSNSKLTYSTFMQKELAAFFLTILKDHWNINLVSRENIDDDILYKRLKEISIFWIYFSKWQRFDRQGTPLPEYVKLTRVLSKAITQYLNYGKDIKNFKYPFLYPENNSFEGYEEFYEDTVRSREQFILYHKILEEKYGSEKQADQYIFNMTRDINDPIKLENGKTIYAYHTDSIVEALNRGFAGGGNCESPYHPSPNTESTNGTTFSPVTKGILFGRYPSANEGILYQFSSLTTVRGRIVPVLINESMYSPDKPADGYNRKDYHDAAMVHSLRNAARYGMDYVFFTTYMTNPNIGCRPITTPGIGFSTTVEYIDQAGYLIKEKVSVDKIVKDKNTDYIFYMFEEDSPFKYADNAIAHVTEKGNIGEKFHASMSSEIRFKDYAYDIEINGVTISTARNTMEGNLIALKRDLISKKKINLNERLKLMYKEYTSEEIFSIIRDLGRLRRKNKLIVQANRTFETEIANFKETTLSLINQITDINMATDRFLKIVYRLSERIAKTIIKDMELKYKDNRLIIAKIPRGGIAVGSKLSRVFSKRLKNPVISKTIDFDRQIINLENIQDGDIIFLCDQVINTGNTIQKNINYITANTDKKVKFVIVAMTADPKAVLKIFRNKDLADFIEHLYVADLRKKIDINGEVTSVIGHPGERSYSNKIDKLYRIGAKLSFSGRSFSVKNKLGTKYTRSLIVTETETGQDFFLKIMVGKAEGERTQNISHLAMEEDFNRGILHNVEYFPEDGFLLHPYISEINIHSYFTKIFQYFPERFTEEFLKLFINLNQTAGFLKSQDQLSLSMTPFDVLFDDKNNQWHITNFYNESSERTTISEEELFNNYQLLLTFLFEQALLNDVDISNQVREIKSLLESRKIKTIENFSAVLKKYLQEINESYSEAVKRAA